MGVRRGNPRIANSRIRVSGREKFLESSSWSQESFPVKSARNRGTIGRRGFRWRKSSRYERLSRTRSRGSRLPIATECGKKTIDPSFPTCIQSLFLVACTFCRVAHFVASGTAHAHSDTCDDRNYWLSLGDGHVGLNGPIVGATCSMRDASYFPRCRAYRF